MMCVLPLWCIIIYLNVSSRKIPNEENEIYTLNILLINGKVKYCLAKNMFNNDFIVTYIPYTWIIYTDYFTLVTMHKDLHSKVCFSHELQRH